MAKLLLTSVIRPFGGPGEGDSVGAELFHAQVTRAQGPFSLRQVIRVWALDYIAENLRTPAVTLHYPSKKELIRELSTGGYTHVGINFVVATFHKVREMVPLIRRYAPGAKIVLGGYGTVLPDELLAPYADAICREEGASFLRRLLGEPEAAKVRAPHACIPAASILSYQQPSVVGHLTAGLGCPNGCDFCCTSHFFKRKYVRFLDTGRDVYDALMKTRARAAADGMRMNSFIVIDEDFFLFEKRAREFLACVREGGESLSIMGFGSVRGLSRFTAREIAEMGFDLVWNAFEGKKAGYGKQQGRSLPELYRELQAVGCAQLTSMIIGFPYQDEATIWAEFEELMALEPGLVQCLIYFAFPGTPFHQQVVAEHRYLERYRDRPDLRRWDGFSMHFEHPKFDGPEHVERVQRAVYARDFERLGPSLLRLARIWLQGHETLRDDPNPLLRARAARQGKDARSVLPTIQAILAFPPSDAVKDRALALKKDLIRLTGEPTVAERARMAATPALFALTRARVAAGLLQQPGLLRTAHRLPGAEETQHTAHVMRLQGGLQAGLELGKALREDAGRHLDRLASMVRSRLPAPPASPQPPESVRHVTERSGPMPASRLPVLQEA